MVLLLWYVKLPKRYIFYISVLVCQRIHGRKVTTPPILCRCRELVHLGKTADEGVIFKKRLSRQRIQKNTLDSCVRSNEYIFEVI